VSDEEGASDDETVSDVADAPDNENVSDGEIIPGDETVSDGDIVPDDEAVSDGDIVPDDETVPEGDTVPDSENADGMQDDGNMAVTAPAIEPDAQADGDDVSESVSAPEITITRGGANKTFALGGEITFEYVNYQGTLFDVSVGQSDNNVTLFYCMDKVTDLEAGAKEEEQMDSLQWGEIPSPPVSIKALNDGSYVVYVKAEAGGQKYYARSSGVVVDTRKPVIKGVEEGKSYPEGTLFQVEDANLESVLVNEQPAALESGSYKVAANGTSCVIRAKDKAGNETICSITVSGNGTSEEEKPEGVKVISESGVYELKAGVKYHLAGGKWKVDGDKSVYQGGNDFYVTADGSYQFTK
ncbi:MAG: hypothetical protein K2N39_05795, partial [Lachnospiraceae bacterium]|nr:hypothetical protein [Lachnospiraceae bacterium]